MALRSSGTHHDALITHQNGRVVSITCSCGEVLDPRSELHHEHVVEAKKREYKAVLDARAGRS